LKTKGISGYGAIGAVVGATYPNELAELRARMSNAWLLIPGYGAQGGGAKDVAAAFHSNGLGAVINNSRGIIFAYQAPRFQHHSNWQGAVEAATIEMNEALRSETSVGRQ
jgi:orotidine-5'-phosphate decarboxylase